MATITKDILNEIARRVAPKRPDQSDSLTATHGATTAVYDLVTTLQRVLDTEDDDTNAVQDVIDDYVDIAQSYNDERVYTIYWLTGDTQTVAGPDAVTAMNNAGIGAGALAAMDFYDAGPRDPNYVWDKEAREWCNVQLRAGAGDEDAE